MKKHAWTDAEKQEVLRRFATETAAAIAKDFGVSTGALEKMISAYRRGMRTGPLGNEAATTPPNVHAGLELSGQSTRIDEAGNMSSRWDLARRPRPPSAPVGADFHATRIAVNTDGEGGEISRWTSYDRKAAQLWEDRKAAIEEFCVEHVRPAEPLPPPSLMSLSDDRKVFYNLGDPHIGMLAHARETGAHFDLRIATSELIECHRQLVALSPPSKQCTIANLGDFWHAQNQEQHTPKGGHKLDVDGRFAKVGRAGLDLVVSLTDAALCKHERVFFRNLRGNHDPEASFWLGEYLRAWYRNEPRFHVYDDIRFVQFEKFGQNLIMWAHGDGFPVERIPDVLVGFGADYISDTRFRFAWTGHVHSRNAKEFGAILWESFNTLAGKDAWAASKGYAALQRLQAICLHSEWGEESRATVGVERVRAAMKGNA